ncbi:hypothetical protein D3C81_217370 [compost metagenome]
MLYFIKFVYSFVLPPGIIIVFLALLSLWMLWKKLRGTAAFLITITLMLYLVSTPLVADPLMRTLENRYPQPSELSGDVLVVLGGGAVTGTPDVDGEGNMGGSAANRLLTAVRLHRESGLPILFSGGKVYADSGNEGDIARRQLIGLGVAPEDILIENRSLNTAQNAEYSVELMKEHDLSRAVLVTAGFQMARAVTEFKHAGMEVQPYPTAYESSSSAAAAWYPGKLAPSADAIGKVSTVLKEYLGSLAAAF